MCKKASPLLWATAFQFNKRSVGLVLPEILEVPLLLHSVLHLSVYLSPVSFLESINLSSLSSEGNISKPL